MKSLWELYRKGRILQAEYYADHINRLAMEPLPEGDVRFLNAEVNRRRLEIDALEVDNSTQPAIRDT